MRVNKKPLLLLSNAIRGRSSEIRDRSTKIRTRSTEIEEYQIKFKKVQWKFGVIEPLCKKYTFQCKEDLPES